MNDYTFVMTPMQHQLDEWLESREERARALFWEMGTGKSKVVVDTAAWLFLRGLIDTVVIIAKKGEYTNWHYTELPAHMPQTVPYDSAVYRSGMREVEKEKIRRLVKPNGKLRILSVNVESMANDGGQCARVLARSSQKGCLLIVDESTCIKNDKAERSKAVKQLAEISQVKYARIMSGTPVPRSPLDLWGQCLILSKVAKRPVLDHTSFFSFRNDYAIQEMQFLGQRSFKKVTGYRNLKRLNAQIATFGSIKERSECLDLPDKIYKKIAVPLTDRQQSLYEEMRDEAFATLGDGEIVEAVNTLSVISKLDQIACGQLKKEDGTFELLPNHRVSALMEQLEVSDKRGIIWCNYKGLLEHVYEQIAESYGSSSVGRFYGGVADDEREYTVKEFQHGSKVRWIVANQQSLGYGRTLTSGKENYYLSNGYNLEHRLQSEDRTMRLGQTDHILYTDFYSPKTVNEKILQSLRDKKHLAHIVLGTNIREWI